MIVSMWPSRSEVFDTVPALLLRLVLVLLDTGLLLRSRFEVASPSTGLDYIADVVALHVDGAEHPSGHVVPNIFIVLFKHVGANVFTAGTINVLADAVSAMALRWLAVELGCSEATWRAVVSAYVWSPISMISCLSGSASSVQVAGILVAAVAAAAGRPILTGLLLALAIQCTGITSRIVSFVIPIILLTIQNSPKRGLKKHWLILCALLITFICATAVATGATSIMLCSKSNSARDRSLGVISRNGVDEQKDKYRWLYETQSSMGTLFRLSKFLTADNLPWTKLRPNLGIQWYLFAQAFPQFR